MEFTQYHTPKSPRCQGNSAALPSSALDSPVSLPYKFLITGSFAKPVSADRLTEMGPEGVAMLHLSPAGYTQVKVMLDLAALRVVGLYRDRVKVKQMLFLWPLVLLIRLYTRLWPRKARERYLLDEVEGPALLTGGNTLIIHARKPS